MSDQEYELDFNVMILNMDYFQLWFLIFQINDQIKKPIFVNRALPSLQEESLKIKLTVPLMKNAGAPHFGGQMGATFLNFILNLEYIQ